MKTNTIHSLRKLGYWVKVSHKRRDFFDQILGTKKQIYEYYKQLSSYGSIRINPLGGITEMDLVDPTTKHHFFARAVCRNDEPFKRKVALNICLGRILKQARQSNLDTVWPI